jgi:hypothetical protein
MAHVVASANGARRPLAPHHLLAYLLSLPERVLRTLAAFVGTVALALTRVLPRPIREGKLYRLVVERQIRMIADDVGGAGLFPGAQPTDARAATRLAVGGAVDNLMMIGLHASPLWILLAATDVSRGAQLFLRELGQELKDRGLMKEGSRLDSLDDVLEGLSGLSDRLADTVDMPPLSVGEMKATLGAVGRDMRKVGSTAVFETADLDGLVDDLRSYAKQSEHGLLETAGALALGSVEKAGHVIEGGAALAGATARFVGRVVWTDVLGDYARTLEKIRRRGFYGTLRGFLRPSAGSLSRLFAWRFVTLTETLLSIGRWQKAPWRRALRSPLPRI